MMIKRILSAKMIMSPSQKPKLMKKMSILIWMWTLKSFEDQDHDDEYLMEA